MSSGFILTFSTSVYGLGSIKVDSLTVSLLLIVILLLTTGLLFVWLSNGDKAP